MGLIGFREEKVFDVLKCSYKIIGNDRIILSKCYPDGFSKNYFRDLFEVIKSLSVGLYLVFSFPVLLIFTIYIFLPRLVIKKKSTN